MFDSVLRSLLGKGQEQAYDPQLPGQKQLEQQQMPQQQWQMPSEWLALIMNNSGESFSDTLAKAAAITHNQQKVENENYEMQMKQQEMLLEQQRAENVAKLLQKPGGFSLAEMLQATGGKNYMGAASLYEAGNPKKEFRPDESLPGGGIYVTPPRAGMNQTSISGSNLDSTNNAQPGDNLNNIDMNESPHERKLRQTRESEKPKELFSQEDKLRDEFRNESKEWKIISDSYHKIASAAKLATGAGDLGITYGVIKMLDPTTGVKEGEEAKLDNTKNVSERILSAYNNARTGQRLLPRERKDLVKLAHTLYKEKAGQQKKTEDNYKKLAKNYNLNEKNIVHGFEKEKDETSINPESPLRSKKLDAIEAAIKRLEAQEREKSTYKKGY